DEIATFHFPDSQFYDFTVTDEMGQEIWRWSWNKSFLQVVLGIGLQPGESMAFTEEWPQMNLETTAEENNVSVGEYIASGFLANQPNNDSVTTTGISIADYFPMQVGNKWNYNLKWDLDVDWEIEITGIENIADTPYFTFDNYSFVHSRYELNKFRRDENGNILTRQNGIENVLYKFPAPEDSTWNFRDWLARKERTDNILYNGVTVPAGTFENLITISFTRDAPDASYIAEQFAPNVGLVRRISDSIAGPRIMELQGAFVNGKYIPPRNSTANWELYE
ncbi:MAG: BsuPI-related putative proteinase inhibitor, partial [Nanoarchaeota archaeon]